MKTKFIVKPWSKPRSKPLSKQTPKLNKNPPKNEKKDLDLDLLKATTQSILAQKHHPGLFLETREQELSYGSKIIGIFCFIVGDISFIRF